MKVAIMQPYFFPYLGYFQLMQAVDVFIVYDNVKYTKKGWINRNRILNQSTTSTLTLPLQSGSDSLLIGQRRLARDFRYTKLLNQLNGVYKSAPHFVPTYELLERILALEESNLFKYLLHSITETHFYLDINREIRVSSTIEIDHTLKGQAKVIALCDAIGASTYINSVGGMKLYNFEAFDRFGINLKFLRPTQFEYMQHKSVFHPNLSIIDVLMFNSLDKVKSALNRYDLVPA